MSASPEIKHIIVQISGPGASHAGIVERGCYTVTKDVVTLCDEHGAALRHDANGGYFREKIAGDADAASLARMLLRRWRRHRHGDDAGFHRPLDYPKTGWA